MKIKTLYKTVRWISSPLQGIIIAGKLKQACNQRVLANQSNVRNFLFRLMIM